MQKESSNFGCNESGRQRGKAVWVGEGWLGGLVTDIHARGWVKKRVKGQEHCYRLLGKLKPRGAHQNPATGLREFALPPLTSGRGAPLHRWPQPCRPLVPWTPPTSGLPAQLQRPMPSGRPRSRKSPQQPRAIPAEPDTPRLPPCTHEAMLMRSL